MVKPAYAGGVIFNRRRSSLLPNLISDFSSTQLIPNALGAWLGLIVCVSLVLGSSLTGLTGIFSLAKSGNFGQPPRSPQQLPSGLPVLVLAKDEATPIAITPAAAEPTAIGLNPTTPSEITQNVAPTSAPDLTPASTPDGNAVGTVPVIATKEPEPTPLPVPTETDPPPPSATKNPILTSTDVAPTKPPDSTATPVPQDTLTPIVATTPAPPTLEPTKPPPPTLVTPELPSATPVTPIVPTVAVVSPTPIDPTAIPPTDPPVVPTVIPTVLPTPTIEDTVETRLPSPTVRVRPSVVVTKPPLPTAHLPATATGIPDDVSPEVPNNKSEGTPVVGLKPTTPPTAPHLVVPTSANTALPIPPMPTVAQSKPSDQNTTDSVFLPAMPMAESAPAVPASPTPKSLVEFVRSAAPKDSDIPRQNIGPILVYTYTQKLLAEGLYVVAACVANVGDQPDNSINLTFNSAPPVLIEHLLSAAEFSEVEHNQRGFVNIATLPPNRQKQFELVLRSPEMPLPDLLTINVSRAYRLTRPEEAKIVCEPQGALSKLPDFAPVEITIGGQQIEPEALAEMIATQVANPTHKARESQVIKGPNDWSFSYDSTYLVFIGVGLAMSAVFGLMTIGRRMRP